MAGFSEALEYLRARSDGHGHVKGGLFERLIKSFLETDNLYRERFE